MPFFWYPAPCAGGRGYEGVHHTPSVIWFRAYSSTNLCMAFVSTEIRTPALVVRSQIQYRSQYLSFEKKVVFCKMRSVEKIPGIPSAAAAAPAPPSIPLPTAPPGASDLAQDCWTF